MPISFDECRGPSYAIKFSAYVYDMVIAVEMVLRVGMNPVKKVFLSGVLTFDKYGNLFS